LNQNEKTLFNLSEKLCLFDLTNTYFEGSVKKNSKAKYGRSKEKRRDCKLLTLALVLDENGFAKYSKLYPGNQYESHTFKEIIQSLLKEKCNDIKPTVIMDAGIAKDKNVNYLKDNGYHYIVVNKGRSDFTSKDYDELETIQERGAGKHKIEVKKLEQENEIYLL